MPTVHTKIFTTYDYSELSEIAKQNAIIDADAKRVLYPEDWSIDIITDFIGIAEAIGLVIPCGVDKEGIVFSANSCPDDGASFIGEYSYRSDWKEALTNEFGGVLLKRFLPYALELQEIHEKINSRKGDITNHISLTNFVIGKYDMTLKVVIERDNHSRYLHDGTKDFENTYALKNGEQENIHQIFLFDKYNEIQSNIEDVFRAMAKNLYNQLLSEKSRFFTRKYFEEEFLDAFPDMQFFEDGTLFIENKK